VAVGVWAGWSQYSCVARAINLQRHHGLSTGTFDPCLFKSSAEKMIEEQGCEGYL